MNKRFLRSLDPYYKKYVDLVKEDDLFDAFDHSLEQIASLNEEELARKGNVIFIPGKWTIKQNLQHIIDWERIFSYRAMLILRNQPQPASHDQDELAKYATVRSKPAKLLVNELGAVRLASIQLFKDLDINSMLRKSCHWERDLSVLEVGFIIVGHQVHHFKIVHEYLNCP